MLDFISHILGFFIAFLLLAKASNTSHQHDQNYALSNSTSLDCETYSRVSLFHVSLKFLPEVVKNGGKLKCRRPNNMMFTLTRITLILLISGDIQTNPGPRTVKAPKYPCGTCGKNVNSNQKAMECEDCLTWYHNKCIDMNDYNYQVHIHHSSYVWVCYKCGVPNFTNSSLFCNFEVSNPFDGLSNSTIDSNKTNNISFTQNQSVGSPLRSSSPKKQKTNQNRFSHKEKPLKLLNINFQSIGNKTSQLHALLETEDPDIIVSTETWLNDSVFSSEFLPDRYQIFRRDRITDTTGGGVFLAFKSNIIAKEEPDLQTNCESIWASIHVKGRSPLYIGAFYRRHFNVTALDQNYVKELDSAISKIPKNSQIILAGDFNVPDINWDTVSFISGGRYPAVSKQIIDLTHEYNMHQIVTEPTRGDSILDLVFTNVPTLVQNVYVIPGLSDHEIVSVDFLVSTQKIKQPKRKIFLYKKGDFEKINTDLSDYANSITEDVYRSSSVGQLWTGFKNVLLSAMDRHIPSKMTKPNSSLPWFKQSHKRALRRKRRAYNKARRTGLETDWKRYRDLRRSSDRSLRKSRSDYLSEVGENLTSSNTKPFWSYIKSLRQSSTGVSPLNTADGVATTAAEKANTLNNKFQSIFTKEDSANLPFVNTSAPSMPPINITTEGIVKLLKELKPQKAPGPDNITPRVLKECADSVAPLLQQIYQKSLSTGMLPDDWRNANVSPIFKKGNRSDPSNYRPVSLTSIPCKLLEHIIHSNMMKHFENHNVLNDEQHGFRKGRSCETQLSLTVNDLAKILDKQGQADVIIMDFSKAFDLVPHQRLLLKLKQAGITGLLHSWLENFLTKRTQQVVLEGVSSASVNVSSGVPQGTVLGPLLFILYLNDLTDGITSQVRLLADDCILYREIKSEQDTQDLQNDINTLCKWETTWQMRFNVAKCYAMHITHKRKPCQTTYSMNGNPLETVKTHTYLGVEINNKLNWVNHIENATSKANKVLGLLRRNLYSCSPSVKEAAYKSLVRPKLEYCASVWDPYHQDYKNRLEAVQRRAARFVCKDFRRKSSVSTMIANLGWKSLEERRAVSRLALLYKATHHQVAINVDHHLSSSEGKKITTRKSSAVSFNHLAPKKDCYKYSFLPRTFAEWNLLPASTRDAPSVEAFKNKLNNMQLSTFVRGAHH